MKKSLFLFSSLVLMSSCWSQTKEIKPNLQEKPKHPVVEEAKKPDCDTKAKEIKEIKPDFKPDSLSLGSGGCTLDEKK